MISLNSDFSGTNYHRLIRHHCTSFKGQRWEKLLLWTTNPRTLWQHGHWLHNFLSLELSSKKRKWNFLIFVEGFACYFQNLEEVGVFGCVCVCWMMHPDSPGHYVHFLCMLVHVGSYDPKKQLLGLNFRGFLLKHAWDASIFHRLKKYDGQNDSFHAVSGHWNHSEHLLWTLEDVSHSLMSSDWSKSASKRPVGALPYI